MKKYRNIITIVLIALLVLLIGGLSGWLLVLKIKGQDISWQSAVRGFGIGTPSAGVNGSTYDIIGSGGSAGGSFSAGGQIGSTVPGSSGAPGGTVAPETSGAQGATTGNLSNSPGSNSSTTSVSLSYASSTSPKVVVPKTPRLWRVTKTPIAGFEFATNSPTVYFAERATGHIFTSDAITGDVLRRTNTLMPKVYEALVSRRGGVIYRTINDSTGATMTFSGIMGSSSSASLGTLTGSNLRNNILSIDADPDSKIIFYIIEESGIFTGYTQSWVEGRSGKEKQVFSSPVGSWKPLVLSDGRIIVTQKPQDGALGYAYEILTDGTLKPLVRAVAGLSILPIANANSLVFGASANNSLSLFLQTSTTTVTLPVKTVADKCVWAPYTKATSKKPASHLVLYCAVPQNADMRNFLQNWYMGSLHTSDSWWKMDLTSGETTQILSAETGGAVLDVIDPSIDPSGNFLGFKNNIDGSLWILRINK
jgi:hypothetical protein